MEENHFGTADGNTPWLTQVWESLLKRETFLRLLTSDSSGSERATLVRPALGPARDDDLMPARLYHTVRDPGDRPRRENSSTRGLPAHEQAAHL